MKGKRLWIGAVLVLVLAAASAAALATDPAQYIEITRDPPGGSSCVCPAIWEPVVCRASDGSLHGFSNGCVAACHGYTSCARIATAP